MAEAGKKILVVEDDEIVSTVIELRLVKLGYAVCGKAATGEDAITLTQDTMPDAILMDISLAGSMDGIEAAKIIKEKFNIPLIFLTAYSDNKILERICPLKPAFFIFKPFTDDDLRIALKISLG